VMTLPHCLLRDKARSRTRVNNEKKDSCATHLPCPSLPSSSLSPPGRLPGSTGSPSLFLPPSRPAHLSPPLPRPSGPGRARGREGGRERGKGGRDPPSRCAEPVRESDRVGHLQPSFPPVLPPLLPSLLFLLLLLLYRPPPPP
jgi:hypothetical protein